MRALPIVPLQRSVQHLLWFVCIAGLAASAAAQGIIDDSEYVAAPKARLRAPPSRSNSVSRPALQETGKTSNF